MGIRETEPGMYLRKADLRDCNLLFQWVNDPEVRKSAFHSKMVSYENHKSWFHHMIGDANEEQYILMKGTQAIGQVRLTVSDETAEIDYSIESSMRGKGYGKIMVGLVIQIVEADYPGIHKLVAKVKADNLASCACFEENGFKEEYKAFGFQIR